MSNKEYHKDNIRKRSLNGSSQTYKNKKKYISAASVKSGSTSSKRRIQSVVADDIPISESTSVKTGGSQTAKVKAEKTKALKAKAEKAGIKTEKAPAAKSSPEKAPAEKTKTDASKAAKARAEEPTQKELLEPAFLNRQTKASAQKQTTSHNYPWKMIIPALAVILCLALFVVASQAGWIQTFLTPQSRRIVKETELQEESTTTTIMHQETSTEKSAKETTTKETTTEYIPSYYVIHVNLAYNRVTVYSRGERLNDGADPKDPKDDEYDLIPVIAFVCSPGVDGTTPTGTYYLQDRNSWCLMIHDVYTQYATRIVDDVMFHSVPYSAQDPSSLATYDYNILGLDASSACIRLNVRDASWIYNNCAYETEVDIFYNYENPGPLDPEPIYTIPEDMEPLCNWDPTDIYSDGNPWLSYEAYLSYDTVELPRESSPDALISAFGPTDDYHHDLSNYFHTDGGYDLQTPGTYYTTAYINIGNCNFSFPITIHVTEEYAEHSDGYYDEYGDFIYYEDYDSDDDDEDEDDYDSEDYDEDGYDYDDYEDVDFSEYDAGGYYGEDAYFENSDDEWYEAW